MCTHLKLLYSAWLRLKRGGSLGKGRKISPSPEGVERYGPKLFTVGVKEVSEASSTIIIDAFGICAAGWGGEGTGLDEALDGAGPVGAFLPKGLNSQHGNDKNSKSEDSFHHLRAGKRAGNGKAGEVGDKQEISPKLSNYESRDIVWLIMCRTTD